MSMMAVTTTSGAICLPTKMEDEVTKFGISRKVADFTGPITMSMNSCGAAQCYVAAIFFMAQSTGIQMTPYQMGIGNSSFLPDVPWYDLCTRRIRYRIYIPCNITWSAA